MPMKGPIFFACRVLATKPDRRDYVIFPGEALANRHDVEVASKGFATEAAARAEIKRLRGSIPDGLDMWLDFFEEESKTAWCWKDDRTRGASQTFTSKRKVLAGWRNDKLIFEPAARRVNTGARAASGRTLAGRDQGAPSAARRLTPVTSSYAAVEPRRFVRSLPRSTMSKRRGFCAACRRQVRRRGVSAAARDGEVNMGLGICENFVAALRGWPIREIERSVRLSETQRVVSMNSLPFSLRAADTLAGICPAENALTPLGRLTQMPPDLEENWSRLKLEPLKGTALRRPSLASHLGGCRHVKQIKNWLLPLCYPTVRNWT